MTDEFGWKLILKEKTTVCNIGMIFDTYKVKNLNNEDIQKFRLQESPYLGYLLFTVRREEFPDGSPKLVAVYQECKGGETVSTKSIFGEFRY